MSVIRPILEYACPVWHNSLTFEQNKRLEFIQKRALKIIYGGDIKYEAMCNNLNLCSLKARREMLCKKFYEPILNERSCLHYLLPNLKNSNIVDKLRECSSYQLPTPRTVRFSKSFLMYALNNY